MRIVIDLQGAQSESRFRGIGRYVLSLAKGMARNRGDHELLIALNDAFPETIEPIRSAFEGLLPSRNIRVWHGVAPVREQYADNDWRRMAAEQLRSTYLRDLAPDALVIGSFFEGFVDDVSTSLEQTGKAPVTATILYDLIPLMNPEKYLVNRAFSEHYERKLDHFKRADLFLAISASARQEGIERLGIPVDQSVDISAAADPSFRKLEVAPAVASSLLERLSIRKPFVMYTGGADERKNLPRLVRAFAALPADVRDRYQLVLVGRFPAGDCEALTRLTRSAGMPRDRVVITGYVTDEDLVLLYNLCTAFVFPSWHEGFGLPVLEAMACGAAAICSNTSSLPEVMDRTDAQFDPLNEDDIRERLHRILTDDDFREELRRYGLQRAPAFSWDASAKRTLTALECRFASVDRARPNWRTVLSASTTSQQELIEAIASLPAGPGEPADNDLCRVAASVHANHEDALASHRETDIPAQGIAWRIEGPFDSSYSLALLNRETARALDSLGHRVVLHSTEGPGDFDPDTRFLAANQDLARMHRLAGDLAPEDVLVTSRNLYPPRVHDMRSQFNLLHHYAWEEAGFPAQWVEDFNEHLQAMTCLSTHVEKIMIDHGVAVPLVTSGCGVDHWERIEPDPDFGLVGRSFRFLHVSSCFPRKGADCLLAAYGESFSSVDDVSLIIKTFPNPHNEIAADLARARAARADFPDVVLIEEDWTDAKLKALYQSSHVLVAPSRAEGFGLPLAEAMLSGMAVITTGWGGQLDFCNPDTAWLVDFRFAPAQTHFKLHDSVWAEPDAKSLSRLMREVFSLDERARRVKVEQGRALLQEKFRWRQVADRLVQTVRRLAQAEPTPAARIGWISSWNTRCGIADYSRHLIDAMPQGIEVFAARTSIMTETDGPEVARSWIQDNADDLSDLHGQVEAREVDTLVLQFNYGFYNFEHLARFIHVQLDADRCVVVMLHATTDPPHVPGKQLDTLRTAFARCDRLLVHSPADMNRLKDLGLVDNVTLFPHGIVDRVVAAAPAKAHAPFRIASYGFFLPHKGLHELLDAVAELRASGLDVELTMVNAEYPVPDSRHLIDQAKAQIKELGLGQHVRLVTDFLPADQSLALLEEADLIVFPYQQTGESSSAAVRTGLAVGRPVAVTPLSIFDDVSAAVFRLPGCAARDIASGLKHLIESIGSNSDFVRETNLSAASWRDAHRHSHLGPRLYRMLLALRARKAYTKSIGTMDMES